MALVSVITPCLNGERFLDAYFATVLSQTHPDVEVVFVNDGSTDRTRELCRRYEPALVARGFKFKYVEQENKGSGAAVREGLKYVTGEAIVLLAVDDRLAPEALGRMSEALQNRPQCGIVRTNGLYCYPDQPGKKPGFFVVNEREKRSVTLFEDLLLERTNNWAGSYAIRSELLFERLGGRSIYPSRYGESLQLLLPVALVSESHFIDEPLALYMVRSGSASNPENRADDHSFQMSRRYEDIRLAVLRQLDMADTERAHYVRRVREDFARKRIRLSLRTGRPDFLDGEYETLHELGALKRRDQAVRRLASGAFRRPILAAARASSLTHRATRTLRARLSVARRSRTRRPLLNENP